MKMPIPKNLGMLGLAIWLILQGLLSLSFLHVSIPHSGDVLAVLAIVVGVLFLLQR
jgi:hypothetical protein